MLNKRLDTYLGRIYVILIVVRYSYIVMNFIIKYDTVYATNNYLSYIYSYWTLTNFCYLICI